MHNAHMYVVYVLMNLFYSIHLDQGLLDLLCVFTQLTTLLKVEEVQSYIHVFFIDYYSISVQSALQYYII